MKPRFVLLFALAALMVLSPVGLWAQGCAMCKAVAATSASGNVYGGSQSVGAGLNKGILFMIVIPYILLLIFFRKKIKGFIQEFSKAQG
jgi:hypothetical protein